MRKKLLSVLLCLTLCVSLFPATRAADGGSRSLFFPRTSYPYGLVGMEESVYDSDGNRVEMRTLLPMEYSEIICVSHEPHRYLTKRPVGDEGGSVYRYGLVDEEGRSILPEEYTDCAYSRGEQELLAFRDQAGKYAYYSIGQERFLTDFAYDVAGAFQQVGLVGVHVTYDEDGLPDRTLYGAVNAEGELVVPLEYSSLGRSAYGDFLFAWKGWAYTDGPDPAVRAGVIDYSGKPIRAGVYPNYELLSAALCMEMPLRASGEAKLKEEDLSITWLPQYSWVEYMPEAERLSYRIGTEGGIAHLDGSDITGPVYRYGVYYCSPGIWYAYDYDAGQWVYLDGDGKALPALAGLEPTQVANRSKQDPAQVIAGAGLSSEVPPWDAGEGLFGFVRNGKVGFADATGKVVIQPAYDYNLYHSAGFDYCFCVNGLAPIYQEGGGRGFIDTQGNWYSRWDMGVLSADEGPNGKYGYRDENWNLVVPYLFDSVGEFENGYALVRKDGVYGLIKDPTDNYASALASLTREGRDDPYEEFSETREIVQILETDHCTVALTKGKFVSYDDYALFLVYKPYAAMGDGTVKQLILPSTVYDKVRAWYKPTDRAPDTLSVSEDGDTLTYVYHFDEALSHAGTVYHEAGTYTYTVSLATGELTATHTDDIPTPPAEPGAGGFTDVDAADWFAPYVDVCVKAGLMNGVGEGRFDPQGTVTLAQAVTLAARIHNIKNGGDGVLPQAPEDYGTVTLEFENGVRLRFDSAECGTTISPMSLGHLVANLSEEKMAAIEWLGAWESARATVWTVLPEPSGPFPCEAYRQSGSDPDRDVLVLYPSPDGTPEEREIVDNLVSQLMKAHRRPLPGDWFRDTVYYLEKEKLTGPLALRPSKPAKTATRGDFVEALHATSADLLTPKLNDISDFPDAGTEYDAKELADMVLDFYNAGVMTGKDSKGTFDGSGTLTRAEAAAIVARIIDKSLRVTAEP